MPYRNDKGLHQDYVKIVRIERAGNALISATSSSLCSPSLETSTSSVMYGLSSSVCSETVTVLDRRPRKIELHKQFFLYNSRQGLCSHWRGRGDRSSGEFIGGVRFQEFWQRTCHCAELHRRFPFSYALRSLKRFLIAAVNKKWTDQRKELAEAAGLSSVCSLQFFIQLRARPLISTRSAQARA